MRVLILGLIILSVACNTDTQDPTEQENLPINELAFDKDKWQTKEGAAYPYREAMLQNIIFNDSIRGLNSEEILALLGEPTRQQDNYLYYRISQNRVGMMTLNAKTMVIKFTDHDTIEWIKVHE